MNKYPWEDDEDEDNVAPIEEFKSSTSGGLESGIELLEALSRSEDEEEEAWVDDGDEGPHQVPQIKIVVETKNAAESNKPKKQLTAAEIAALGLPVNDGFMISPDNFDEYLNEMKTAVQGGNEEFDSADEKVEGETNSVSEDLFVPALIPNLPSNAPAACSPRTRDASRYAPPPLHPKKRFMGMEELPLRTRQAIAIVAHPPVPNKQLTGAARYLWDWYEDEYGEEPSLGEMVSWWWRAARRYVDIRKAWADEMKKVWKSDERPGAPDPATASPNAFHAHASYYAACAFISAKWIDPDEPSSRELLEAAGFLAPPVSTRDRISQSLVAAETVQ